MKNFDGATSKRMAKIKSKDSKIELMLRRRLHSLGYRYKIHYSDVPGKPDIAFTKQRLAIFIDSHFWHGYQFEKLKEKEFNNKDYWISKIKRNVDRDKIVNDKLRKEGWMVIRFWEHQLKENIDECINLIREKIKG